MADDWWAKKLGAQPGTQTAPAQRAQFLRPGSPPAVQAAYLHGYAGHPPASEPLPPAPPPSEPLTDAESISQALQQETTVVPTQAIGTRTETTHCPSCGGGNYFSRSQGVVRGPAPDPECFDCGFPLVQSGSGMGSLAGVNASGPAQHAAQAHTQAPPMNTIIGRV